jgi:hypothetical protein
MKKKPNKTDINKKKVLEQLEKSLGVVTIACKNAGVDRSQFYVWLQKDKEFADSVAELDNVALDFAESQLHKQIKDGVPSSTIFYLKTRGKKRGYIERQEITGKDGEPLAITPEEREARIAALEARVKKGK